LIPLFQIALLTVILQEFARFGGLQLLFSLGATILVAGTILSFTANQ
jgi:hypothetical protein